MPELPRGDFGVKELNINANIDANVKKDVKLDTKLDAKLQHDLNANIDATVNQTVNETSTQTVTETSNQTITETSTQTVTETSNQTIAQTVAQTVAATLEHLFTANLTHGLNFGGSFKIEGVNSKWGLDDLIAYNELNKTLRHNLLKEIQGAVLDNYENVVEAYHIPLEEYTWLTTMKVVDALDSTSATDILSANQGRVLKEMVEDAVERLNKAIADEAAARSGADTTLQNNINSEATTRANADAALQRNIDGEATARGNEDNRIWNRINGLGFGDIAGTLGLNRTTGSLDASRVNGLVDAIKQNTVAEGEVSANGYAKFGNGLIIQWGRTPTRTTFTEDVFTQGFPIAFPNNCFAVIMSMNIVANKSLDANYWPQLLSHNRSSFSYWYQAAENAASTDHRIEFVAFGN